MDFSTYLAIERSKDAAKHAFVSMFSEMSVAILTASLLWTVFPTKWLVVWCLCCCAVSSIAFALHKLVTPEKPWFSSLNWQIANSCASFFVAFSWGLVTLFFFDPDNIYYLVFIVAIYTGYVSGALSVTFSHHQSFVAFIIGITLPFAGRMFYQGETLHITIGGLAIFYIAMLAYVSRNIHFMFMDSARTQFDNIQLVEKLRIEKTKAEEAVTSKNQFLASASHDLRQPLNAISLLANANTAGDRTLEKNNMSKIQTLTQELGGMLNGLVEVSQLHSSTIKNNPKHIHLTQFLNQSVGDFFKQATDKGLTIKLEAMDLVSFVDPILLKRVINNLLDNAIKYTEDGSILIQADTYSGSAQIRIKDSGIGIPKAMQSKIFDEFFQINNPERDRSKGFGLGLATVRLICDLIDADMSFKSDTQQGTDISIQIPLGDPLKVEKSITTEPFTTGCLSGLNVVVIDDDIASLRGMHILLKTWGLNTRLFSDLREIQVALEQGLKKPELIVSDLRLRDNLSGVDVIQTLREAFLEDIPAVIVTGDTTPDRMAFASNANAEILYKPIDTNQLFNIIVKLVGV